jgi:membrane protein
VMLTAASGVLVSLMDGFRRAYCIPNPWGFWRERIMAFLLIPLSLLPMAFATVLVAFGNQVENWLSLHTWYELRPLVVVSWRAGRWIISGITSVTVIALIYHMSVPRTQSWRRVLPGAALATLMWFGATLAFGLYVTRYANYTAIYGSLGAAIALLVWLYIVSIVLLIGAEFNALVFPKLEA